LSYDLFVSMGLVAPPSLVGPLPVPCNEKIILRSSYCPCFPTNLGVKQVQNTQEHHTLPVTYVRTTPREHGSTTPSTLLPLMDLSFAPIHQHLQTFQTNYATPSSVCLGCLNQVIHQMAKAMLMVTIRFSIAKAQAEDQHRTYVSTPSRIRHNPPSTTGAVEREAVLLVSTPSL